MNTKKKPSGTLQNREKEEVCDTVNKRTPKYLQKYLLFVLKYNKN